MKLPSLTKLRKQTLATFKRFPVALISTVTATVSCIYLIAVNGQDDFFYLGKVAVVAVLGIPLFTVIPLIAEKKQWSFSVHSVTALLGVALLFGYYFFLPEAPESGSVYVIYRYILYFIGLHLLVAVGPYWGKDQILGFWQYNKMLFLRILTAALFSGVLFLGLAAALGSIQVLFEVEINIEWYQKLFLVIAGIFNTWFFLAGIPEPIQKLDSVSIYPKGLKVFARNVLLPLVAIYMIILYLYAAKIIIQWSWPEGWVSTLILFFSIFGILAILLLYPLQNKTDHQWIKRFSTSYYWILFPMTIFLILAIWRRISEYGFTVERYFVFVLGLWLLALVVYFIFSKKQNIKVIPISLLIIAFAISFGPWGAFVVSERSQINRLQTILKENNILQNGSVHKASEPLSDHDLAQVSSILQYLNRTHGLNGIKPWFNNNLDQIISDKHEINYNNPEQITRFLDLGNINDLDEIENNKQNYFYTERKPVIATQKIDWLIKDEVHWSIDDSVAYHLGKQLLMIEQHERNPHIQIYIENNKQQAVNINLQNIIHSLLQQVDHHQNELPPEAMIFEFSNQSLAVVLYLNRIQWDWQKDTANVETADFTIGISTKGPFKNL